MAGERSQAPDDDEATLAMLTAADAEVRVAILHALIERPPADPRIHASVSRLCEDRTPCVLGHPTLVGEVRWLAAQALVAMSAAELIPSPSEFPRPQTAEQLGARAAELGVPFPERGYEGLVELFAALRDLGALPTEDGRSPR